MRSPVCSQGHACERALQFEFTATPKDEGQNFSGQSLRIFAIGHALEDLAVAWLRGAGFDLYTRNGNRAVGGATRSKHLDGAAFDIAMANHDPVDFEAAAREVGFLGFGFYPRSGFINVDLGPARQWGDRFPVRATASAAETPPAREVLAESRTMKGGGAAGVATLGAASVEVAHSVLAETQSAILPLVPYLDTLRWVFIAVALGGIAVTIYARLDDWRWGRR